MRIVESEIESEVEGQIERVIYRNESGYTVATIRDTSYGLLTVVGNLFCINPGECLRLKGQWRNHPRYGNQFEIVSYEHIFPVTTAGIEKYLSSGLIKGIGPVMSKRIVEKFGVDTLKIIDSSVYRLKEVEGIGETRVEIIRKAWNEQKEIREVMIFLQGHGVSPSYATKIYNTYGKNSIKVVKENPYRLIYDISGIGFLTADRIARSVGIPEDSTIRIEAGIFYILSRATENGHVCLPYKSLITDCKDLLSIDIDDDIIVKVLETITLNNKLVVENHTDQVMVYLAGLHRCETGIVNRLKDIISSSKNIERSDKDRIIEQVQKELRITLTRKQLQAVRESVDKKVLIITGGPGTGKTTIINVIASVYETMGMTVFLCAPTGRASKRIAEATGYEAKTIHRMLEYNPQERKFRKNEHNPIEADLIIVDESSMIDTTLMYHLLKAIPDSSTLILVGDVDQLPSVGPGNVLKDIIDSEVVPVVRLDEIFRQSENSLIILNAHRINKGEMPYLSYRERQNRDFYFYEISDPEDVLRRIVQLCKYEIPSSFGYDPVDDIQVLTPMYKGIVGALNLNTELQKQLNDSKDELIRDGRVLKVGDKVMHTKNNYVKDVYNGDIGRITYIDKELQKVIISYDGRTVTYEYSELDEITLAYAISVHKSQGSEYPVVIMPVMTQHYILLQRNLLYTGITRGKDMVVLIGTKKSIAIAVRNNNPQRRYTLLKSRLVEGYFL